MTIEGIGVVVGVIGLLAVTLVIVGVLIALANRHIAGRRTRFDGLFGGIGRAAQMGSHLRADTPSPDELGLRLPPRPDGMPEPRRRSRRRSRG
jgi:hypothetical protein